MKMKGYGTPVARWEPESRRATLLQLEGSGARIGPGGTARVATDRMVVSGSSLARAPLPRGQHGMAYEASVLLKLRVCHLTPIAHQRTTSSQAIQCRPYVMFAWRAT